MHTSIYLNGRQALQTSKWLGNDAPTQLAMRDPVHAQNRSTKSRLWSHILNQALQKLYGQLRHTSKLLTEASRIPTPRGTSFGNTNRMIHLLSKGVSTMVPNTYKLCPQQCPVTSVKVTFAVKHPTPCNNWPAVSQHPLHKRVSNCYISPILQIHHRNTRS